MLILRRALCDDILSDATRVEDILSVRRRVFDANIYNLTIGENEIYYMEYLDWRYTEEMKNQNP